MLLIKAFLVPNNILGLHRPGLTLLIFTACCVLHAMFAIA